MDKNKQVIALKGLIFQKGKLLIVRRSNHDDVGAGTWECPGGKVEFGEQLEETLLREIKEEVGLDCCIKRVLYATSIKTSESRQVIIIAYLCHANSDIISLSKEHSDYRWIVKSEINMLDSGIVEDFYKYHVLDLEEWSD